MESHARDLDNYVNIARNRRRRAKALLDFERHDDDELGFRKNDIITVSIWTSLLWLVYFSVAAFVVNCLAAYIAPSVFFFGRFWPLALCRYLRVIMSFLLPISHC